MKDLLIWIATVGGLISGLLFPAAIILCFDDKKKGGLKVLAMIVVLILNFVIGIIWLCIEGTRLEDDHERLGRAAVKRVVKQQGVKKGGEPWIKF